MINCIAIDDEPPALDLLKTYCSKLVYLNLLRTFTSTSEASSFLKKFPVDLIFLDIQMPEISGIDFFRSLDEPKLVIFTTAYSEYAVEGFNLCAVDYLLKPINFTRFEQAVLKTKEYLEYLKNRSSPTEKFLFVRSEYRLMKIAFSEILYIQGLDNYVRIFTDKNKSIISRVSMKEIYESLPGNVFTRVHRSFIINTTKDLSFSNKKIQIGEKQIPVGISFENEVKKIFGTS
ncbi:MAG: LytTR family DNA-binding domain-containing protein [Bacteroidales bacterium]|nr:LytTR family DNA-binding domain-containing protein [Bacteroidales bacterium]